MILHHYTAVNAVVFMYVTYVTLNVFNNTKQTLLKPMKRSYFSHCTTSVEDPLYTFKLQKQYFAY